MRAHLGDGADRSVRRARRRRHLKAQIRLLARVGQAEGPHGRIRLPSVLDFQMHFTGYLRGIRLDLRPYVLRRAVRKHKNALGQIHCDRRHDSDRPQHLAALRVYVAILQRALQLDSFRSRLNLESPQVERRVIGLFAHFLMVDRIRAAGLRLHQPEGL